MAAATDERRQHGSEVPTGHQSARVPRQAPASSRSVVVGRRRLANAATAGLSVLLVLLVVWSATVGPARVPLAAAAATLLQAVGVSPEALGLPLPSETQRQIVLNIRLPRILAAALVGAALALVGTVMQALFRNPMADPGIVGVSSGAGLGAVAAIASGAAAAAWFALPLAAFVGALCSTAAVFLFSLRQGRSQMATLLLAGVAATYLTSAATSALISFTYDRDTLREMLFWLLGGFDNRSWEHVRLLFGPVLVGAAVFLSQARRLNLLLLGEEDAQSLGVPVQSVRAVLLVVAALVTGIAVSVSGLVGFVGLVVPHAARMIAGSDHRLLLPLSGLGGAAFLVLADSAARTLVQPAELRVGIVTAFVGAPVFLFVLARSRANLRSL